MSSVGISIIIPAFNTEKYIGEALESIQAQTELPNEIILIDDGSTDKTNEIASLYKFNCKYIIIRTKNSGLGKARNTGLMAATSKYIYFFDSDDKLEKNFIKDIKQDIIKNKFPDIIFFSGQSFNDKNYTGNRWVEYKRNFSGHFSDRDNLITQGDLSDGLFCSACMYISQKKIWVDKELKFKEIYREDEDIFLDLILSCNSFLVVDKVYFFRRNRDGSIMASNLNNKHTQGLLSCIESQTNILKTKKLSQIEKKYISKRLHSLLLVYIKTSRIIKQRINKYSIIKAVLKIKKISIAKNVLLYYLRIYQIKNWIKTRHAKN